jgi:hypothetical protein
MFSERTPANEKEMTTQWINNHQGSAPSYWLKVKDTIWLPKIYELKSYKGQMMVEGNSM